MNRKFYLIFFFALLWSGMAMAQAGLNKANKLYCKLAFNEAKDLYLDYIEGSNSPDPDAYFKLAECYRNLDLPYDAVQWYAKSVEYEDNSPNDFLQYALMLQQVEDYEKAREWFVKYNDAVPDDERGWRGILACDNVEELKQNKNNYIVENAEVINSSASDISPVLINDKLIFTSDRKVKGYSKKEFQWTGASFYNIFEAEQKSPGVLGSPELLSGDANSQYHDGIVTISADGKLMIFTRTFDEKAKVKGDCERKEVYNLKLMSARIDPATGEWGSPSDEEFQNINNKDYIVAHPTLSADGVRLYFASDNPNFNGYRGGTDLYVSYYEGGHWSAPVNLGPSINTPGNEEFPFITQDSVLYFSSDANLGPGGLGGMDIYRAQMGKNGKFMAPEHLGSPINSSRDDFGLIIHKDSTARTYGYFASSRGTRGDAKAKGKDDIYFFYPGGPVYLKIAAISDCNEQSLKNVSIEIYKGGQLLASGETDDNGIFFSNSLMSKNTKYTLKAKYGDREVEKSFHSYGKSDGDTVTAEVRFEGSLRVQGVAYNSVTHKALANAEILAKSKGVVVSRTQSDENGFYSIDLEPDNEYLIIANKFGNRGDTVGINTIGMDCEVITQDMYLTPGSMFLTNVYYYFDKAYIYRYPEALSELNKLIEFLNDNPDYIIEIRSHTDARDTYKYNEALGQRRAQAVKDYLIDHGISEERLVPVSYGEYCPTNGCADGVPCTEVQHQRNRRTEIKVINYNGELVLRTRENPKWTADADFYVEGGKYFEAGKGSNWQNEEDFQSKYGDWHDIPVRKDCSDVIRVIELNGEGQ